MKFTVLQPDHLTGDLTRRWAEIQEANSALASPYFRPEFTQAVAAVRDDVRIGVMEDAGRVVGFFPFHRRRGGIGRPIGLGLSDYHGVIVEPGVEWTVAELLHGCGLVRYEFDHLPVTQKPFEASIRKVDESPIIELEGGFDTFEASRDKSGRKQLREVERKRAKLEADVGELRMVAGSTDPEVLRTLIALKSQQCRQTGTVDYFAFNWCVALIERLHAIRAAEFAGELFALYAGDRLVAAHFIIRTDRVWHSWFPTYHGEYHAYSPGMILLVDMIRQAASRGVAWIDLGKGMSLYKRRMMTGKIEVAEGSAEVPSMLNRARRLRNKTEQWARSSIFKPVLRLPGRMIRHVERRRKYD